MKKNREQIEISHENKELEQQKIILKEINKHLEEKLKKFEDGIDRESEIHRINELEQQKILLNELNIMISEDSDSLDEVLTILSHEFRTPMVPIKAYTDMLLEGHLGELTIDQKAKLEVVQNSISSLHELVSNSIDSKKIELGQIKMNKIKTDLTKLIVNTINDTNTKTEKNVNWVYLPREEIVVLCDSERIRQVLISLIKNCLKVIPSGIGKISITAECVNDEVIVVVEDNGKGIPSDKLTRIFSKYGKTDRSEIRDDAGIGLGLHLCKQIIDAHGGRIWIESQEKVGTRVYFTLPI